MNIMGELALIFGICLVGEGVAALLPVAFPASVISMVLLMVLLLTGVVKDRHIQTASHFLVANMAFFFLPSFVGLLEHIELLKSQLVPLLLIIVLTTPVVYLVTGWTVRLLMLRHRNRKEDRHA
ncbi:CidA/LrgA family protein [Pseudoflavonifractor capillosus]|uniref:CidA/LrgA family protein n=1 Tax=Pseudoflavonifractor capillosus TaxID=106588 RepID=UPI0019588B6C|nr:CidA/LrgA family protein [Pseudoflavonifractor capillosus]MBM6679495.1 CidA/LrgA family protein [Pseudoflavonifractor capillosus]MBS6349491.1 CidA/LrgA family protein [Oscillospiraceae bacterium]